ncbi:MAG TPA: hypothetical protein VE967_19565 [Gemmatimonadaceae bacterium]|nr:hypothetical protein [Gemmatimonadaceae bacterium]
MNVEGWQAGLFFGTAFTLVAEFAVRTVLHKVRHRGHDHCTNCQGCLRPDGRGEGALETLFVCPVCGDTVPEWAPHDQTHTIPIGEVVCQCGAAFGQRLPLDSCPVHGPDKQNFEERK